MNDPQPETNGWTVTSTELWEMWPESCRKQVKSRTGKGRSFTHLHLIRSPFPPISIGQLFDVVGEIMEVKLGGDPSGWNRVSTFTNYQSVLRTTLAELFAMDRSEVETYLVMREIEK